MLPFLKKHLAPNRVAVYLTAVAALATAVSGVVVELDTTSVVGLVAGLAALVRVVDVWLKGWQQYERALYQSEMEFQASEYAKQVAAAQAEAAQQVGGRRSTPKPVLPR